MNTFGNESFSIKSSYSKILIIRALASKMEQGSMQTKYMQIENNLENLEDIRKTISE